MVLVSRHVPGDAVPTGRLGSIRFSLSCRERSCKGAGALLAEKGRASTPHGKNADGGMHSAGLFFLREGRIV